MGLLIACILIYHYGMAWWWYLIAIVFLGAEEAAHKTRFTDLFGISRRIEDMNRRSFEHLFERISDLESRLDSLKGKIDRD